ncbi:MAG: ribbon-helix-helix protein, CopG family [Mycolicibacterium sp.]|uniref:ribbon-helix-helix protein, CopG family n=1 Tax=Mycolicibacterium sp. TaxID=2320850 RepID=UPI003D131B62
MADRSGLQGASVVSGDAVRTSLHLPAEVRAALKSLAVERDTTMSVLIRAAIATGLRKPAALALESLPYRRAVTGMRTTLDLPRDMHRALKRLAARTNTSVQALIAAAIKGVDGYAQEISAVLEGRLDSEESEVVEPAPGTQETPPEVV